METWKKLCKAEDPEIEEAIKEAHKEKKPLIKEGDEFKSPKAYSERDRGLLMNYHYRQAEHHAKTAKHPSTPEKLRDYHQKLSAKHAEAWNKLHSSQWKKE